MKYIFLDIDGVLNAPGEKNLIDGIIELGKFNLLKDIMSKTNAKVVIISSRRYYEEDRNQLLKVLDDIYFDLSFISYKPNFKYRKDEILAYLKNHPCESYIILDDIDSNYTKDEEVKKHFIYINGFIGLTEEDSKKAISLLNN